MVPTEKKNVLCNVLCNFDLHITVHVERYLIHKILNLINMFTENQNSELKQNMSIVLILILINQVE